ncbi:hypothetical protein MJT46_016773 [Ovis ammon polii x Ovis aries]|nr:hypothetical protein MJT46_016773 [Ovis ammon polii x Ovis aries]
MGLTIPPHIPSAPPPRSTCSGGLWQCQDLPCPGTCSVQGGSHISTYDEKLYDVHGDCSYVLTKVCADSALTVLADLRKCGLTDNENCLKTVTLSLNGGDTTVQIQANGGVFVNSIYTQLPVSVADVTVFRPSSFFILVQTGPWLQLQVQLAPLMQVFLRLDPAYRGRMCGLCGNFNQNQADDFRTVGGVVEATAAAFANTWKTQAACPNVKNSFEDPCSLSVENENYARHWCSLLTRPAGPFSPCHSVVSPGPFHSNCLFDTCNCEKSEDCMCAALSSYVWACAARGVLLRGWRDGVCTKYASSCPKTQSYAHVVDSCQPTCRSLSQPDVSCDVAFVPVDGCVCPQGTFLDDAGDCVPAEACPCYLGGTVVAPGEVVHDSGVVCSCVSGRLSCLGATEQSTGCVAPMVFLDCSNASADAPGAECVRSCHTLDVDCFSTHCVSGCVCPVGLLSDGSGGCVAKEDCPCVHNEAAYKPGQVIKVDCNTCTCRGRRWECSDRPCLGTCVAYGDGHFLTFDGERYGFEGSCEYTLAQDYCVGGDTANGTFRIVTENVPCGTTGVTCSKAIKIFLGSYELILHEGTHRVLQRGPGGDLPYRVRYMGVYLTVETHSGVVVSWDRKTSVIIRLRHEYKGRVCGLCGNFDDNALNDFTTRSQSVVGDVLEFGNSWKFSPSCPDALAPRDPCTANPYRRSWAQKQCSIINSATFSACRSQVDSTRYYEACVSDACACDSGADCECFCTAVAAYAQACHEAGVCVSWRTPDVCPLFCDYYNPHGECEWHYQPCGVPCLKTCRNPSGLCLMDLPGLEGCYPECPPSKPLFNEDRMECVAQCSGCYDRDGNYYDVGTRVPTTENCQSCACTSSGLQCTHSPEACTCTYEGRTYAYGDVIYNTTDGLGACLIAICRDNGTIVRRAMECPGTPSITPFTFTSTAAPPSTTGLVPTPSTVCVRKACQWSDWYDGGRPEPGVSGGDFETFENLRQRGYQVCLAPVDIECQAQLFPGMPLEKLAQKVECSQDKGLTCLNSEQSPPLCHNYKLRVLCCDYVPCGTSQPPSSQTTPTRPPTHPTTAVLTSQTATTKLTTTTTSEGSSSVFPATTTCEPHCQWTEWFDVDYPKYEEGGGDFETYEKIRAAGGAVCEQPQEIKCEAENYPGLALEQVGQRVHCDVRFGLVCRNEEQPGLFKMCINYRGPTSVLATTQTSTAGSQPEAPLSTTGTPSTQHPRTSTPVPATATTGPTTSQATTSCQPECTWTEWFDVDYPKYEEGGGDFETYEKIRAAGGAVCEQPQEIKCEAENYPGLRVEQVGQRVHCDVRFGLVCRNEEQLGLFKMCINYRHPRTSTPVPATATTGPTTSQATTSCQPECTWTEWFDVDYPKYEEGGGDFETYEKIRAAGGAVCEQPQEIKCEAENYPGLRVEQVGQRVHCDVRFGLVCRNEEQLGLFKMCINYRGPTSVLATTQTSTAGSQPEAPLSTTGTPSTQHPRTSTPVPATATTGPTTSQATTSCQPECTWTEWFDVDYPKYEEGGGDFETYEKIRAVGGAVCEQPQEIKCEAENYPGLRVEQVGQRVHCDVRFGLVCRNEEQLGLFKMCINYRGPTSVLATTQTSTAGSQPEAPLSTTGTPSTQHPRTSTPVPATATTGPTTSQATTSCQPKCTWTEWFDVDFPTSGVTGGDIETYANIRAAGGKMCQDPEKIECRAESYPEVSIDQIGQVLTCSLETGLVCRNADQRGPFTMCFNYNVRVYCCDDARHCPTTASPDLRSTSLPPGSSPGTGPWPPTSTTAWPPLSTSKALPTTPKPTWTGAPSTVTLVTSHIPESTSVTSLPTTHTHFLPPTTSKGTTQVAELPTRPSETTTRPPVTTLSTGQATSSTGAGTRTSLSPPGPEPSTSSLGTTLGTPTTTTTSAATLSSPKAHTSGTTLVPTSAGTASTTCEHQCAWTDWMDQSYPHPGADGGDFETYANIRAAGGAICEQPLKLECRAEPLPDTPLTDLGQVVLCQREVGLVCRNQDQSGQMCFNYQIRLLCCEKSYCPSTAITTSTPTPTRDVVYNKTDGAGCPFLAICNQRCELDRFQGACTTSSPTGTSASVPPTTPVSGCDRTIPPRKVNESWFLEDCTVARCEGDNRVTLLGPRPMNSITCVNGHLPVKVQNQSHHCAYRYECECVCSAWGSSHYETFDGTSYTFRDNCTYVLVREIQPRHGNFRVLLHNRFCEAAAHCPRALSTHYQSTDVVLSTTTSADGQEESLILLDQTRVRQSFSKNGVAVTLTGATGMRVDIPAIGVSITFNGRVFQARLSYSHFSHNTEGQCGTCTNNRRDECRRPDGTMARTCRDMARSWLVSDSSGEGCGEPTGLPPTTSPLLPGTSTPAIHPSCPPEPLCELMLSSVFAGCHSLIPPGPYFNACVSDSCWPGHGRKVLCQSLETYAELCRSRGVCADWRNATHGLCDLACPPTKVYKSCGPVQPESCDSRSQSLQSVGLAEGCFCPDGHILFNSHRDICVPECSCVGPDGLPKVPGERWISNCQSCVCDKGTVSVQCVPMECPAPDQPQECSRAGFVAVSRPLANNPCCMENLCVCNASTCPQSPPACGRGEKVVRTQVEGDCCPTFICEPLLCSFNGTVYGVGATVPGVAPCHTCACLSMGSEDPTVRCEEEACNTTCLPFNETWINSLVDNCTEYHCQARDGPPMLTPTPVVCPDVSPCKGILKKIGCCYSCVQTDACQVHTNMTVLRHRGCVTQTAVKVSFCEGSCPQVSRYSMETQARQCSCRCCQETRTHQEAVTMQCPDGTAFQHTYTHVDECGCVPACASSPQTLEESASTFPTLGSTAV